MCVYTYTVIMEVICVICKLTVSVDYVVVIGGLENLRNTSFSRGDDVIECLVGKNSVTVHIKCRKDYTRRVIASPYTSVKPKFILRDKDESEFNFKKDCLFCAKLIQFEEWENIQIITLL